MWFLSLSVFIAAMSVPFREKKAELPLVSISTALLFALPNIRNSQPGVPTPVGTTEDSKSNILLPNSAYHFYSHVPIYIVVGFFWNILLVAVRYVKPLLSFPPPFFFSHFSF